MKKIFLSGLVFLLTVSLSACAGNTASSLQSQGSSELKGDIGNSVIKVVSGYQSPPNYVIPNQVCQIGKSITTIDPRDPNKKTPDYTYVLNKAWRTKSRGSFNKDYFLYFGNEKADSEGNLSGSISYLFINITIKNEKNQPVNLNVNSFPVAMADENNAFIDGTNQAQYMDIPQHKPENPDFFNYRLNAKQEQTFTIGYFLEDKLLASDKLYFVAGNIGDSTYNDLNRFIKIGPVPEE